jgi:hypothetical protein
MIVTLDPDVAERIEQEVRRAGKPAQAVVNEALRTRLGLKGKASAREPFRVQPHDFRFAAGLDLEKMNRLVDDLEAAAAAQKVGSDPARHQSSPPRVQLPFSCARGSTEVVGRTVKDLECSSKLREVVPFKKP